ncbi:E3 ubiquitin-protein ligase complex slx8-rfp subunit slx8 [Drosophila eugracilis]|uniref:E3 ubiquitin-protein ligase complex slx8-rfp subunit slx8 n=1 Tax=Drosophila eugracilis TaxID=29029 RepID=UPI001BD9E6F0|nr:E3 ubiquitin-protein ligase complex slx8-rfp subunit slx8 [Drosophila eugracilis]
MSDSTIFSFDSAAESPNLGQSTDSNVSNSSASSSSSVASGATNSSLESNSDLESPSSSESPSSEERNLSAHSTSPLPSNSSLHYDLSPETSISVTSTDGSNFLLSPQNGSSLSVVNFSVPNDDTPSQLRSLSRNLDQMEENLDRISSYCDQVVSLIRNDNPPTSTSTPSVVRNNRHRSSISPVEVIDLSLLEYVPPVRSARNRAPDAVIDLCTPDGRRSRLGDRQSNDSFTPSSNRRRFTVQSAPIFPVVDLDDVSPPKRHQRDPDLSQREDSYKCPVCMEAVSKREPVSTKCGHVFCRECIQTAISSTHKCPMCNKKLSARQYFRIYL